MEENAGFEEEYLEEEFLGEGGVVAEEEGGFVGGVAAGGVRAEMVGMGVGVRV